MRIYELNAYEKESIRRIKWLIENYCEGRQADFANRTGLHKSTISQYLSSAHAPTRQSAMKIAESFRVNPDWVQGYDVPMRKEEIKDDTLTSIPVYGRIPSDIPIGQVTNVVGTEGVRIDNADHDLFAFAISDDAMNPKISKGDVAIIKPASSAKDNDLVLVSMNGEDAKVRRFKTYADSIALVSDNHAFPPHHCAKANADYKILGKVIELRVRF